MAVKRYAKQGQGHPNALLFPSSPIALSDVEAVLVEQPSLIARSNGIGALAEVECQEHPVSLQAMPRGSR
jgi:hypothetical protein